MAGTGTGRHVADTVDKGADVAAATSGTDTVWASAGAALMRR